MNDLEILKQTRIENLRELLEYTRLLELKCINNSDLKIRDLCEETRKKIIKLIQEINYGIF